MSTDDYLPGQTWEQMIEHLDDLVAFAESENYPALAALLGSAREVAVARPHVFASREENDVSRRLRQRPVPPDLPPG